MHNINLIKGAIENRQYPCCGTNPLNVSRYGYDLICISDNTETYYIGTCANVDYPLINSIINQRYFRAIYSAIQDSVKQGIIKIDINYVNIYCSADAEQRNVIVNTDTVSVKFTLKDLSHYHMIDFVLGIVRYIVPNDN